MNYLIVMHQSGGCDYTIGCGIKTFTINAYDEHNLNEQCYKLFDEYNNTDVDISRIEIYEINKNALVDIDSYIIRQKQEIELEKEIANKEKRRQEFLKLKKECE